MNRREMIRYIREETIVSEEQRISLIQTLSRHLNNFDSLCCWIKGLNIFASGTFQEHLSFERREVLKTMTRGIEEKKSNETFGKVMGTFFEKASNFSGAVLVELQKEKEIRIRALMVQLLLHFSNHPMEGSSLSDYLSGLHHRDEIFRCKILHFLYRHYGVEALRFILQEVVKIAPPPSLFFSIALHHYLRLHPEMEWGEEIKRMIWSRVNLSENQAEKDRILILFQHMGHPILRHDFLSLIHTGEEPKPQVSHKSDENLTRLRLERFAKIESSVK